MNSSSFSPGDRVLLTSQGCNRPASELMAVWQVVQVRGTQVIARVAEEQTVPDLDVTGDRSFPSSWLVLYRSVAVDDEEF